ncbi:MAG TPA: FAD-dependent oxidoreductase [Microbacterium sp.]|nr:FAD-dependent oxidoreductase [Microbacterium sp.]
MIVIGAGVAGLVVARDLARAGIAVSVIEASDRVGGQLASIRIAGLELDAAAESFATRGGAVVDLASELGLAGDVVLPRDSPAWLVDARGRAHPLPAASVLGIPADPRARDVVIAIGRRAAWRATLDAVMPLRRPEAYLSLGDLVRRRMGARVRDGLVAPVVRGVYSTTPDALSVALASPGLAGALRSSRSLAAAVASLRAASPAGSQVAGLRGGVHGLAIALERDARAAGAHIVLDSRVVRADAVGVVLSSGEHLRGHVVSAAAEVGGPALRTRTITVATAVVDSPELDRAPRGTGALIEEGVAGIAARAFTHSSAKWAWLADELPGGRHVVRLSYDEMPDHPEETVPSDLRAITGARVDRLVELDVRTWTRTLEAQPAVGGPDAVGEAASVTGLASIVPAARALARRISTDVKAARTGGAEG